MNRRDRRAQDAEHRRALKRLESGAMTREEYDRVFGRVAYGEGVPILGQEMSAEDMLHVLGTVVQRCVTALRGPDGRPDLGPPIPRGYIGAHLEPPKGIMPALPVTLALFRMPLAPEPVT